MDNILRRLAFCTFSTGSSMVRPVLDDWEEFLGGRPAEVIFAVGSAGAVPPIYEELLAEGRIDRLIRIDSAGRSPEAMNAGAVYEAVRAATSEWVLLAKLDTLPFRSGHDHWLPDAVRAIDEGGFAGLTATTPFRPGQAPDSEYRAYRKYSENFAITRRSEWIEAIEATVGATGHGGDIAQDPCFGGGDHRYINEVAFEAWLERQGRSILARRESRDWSIFHVNVWGDRLRAVRESYRARKGIDRFLNLEIPSDRDYLHPWELYYGTPPPSRVQMLRLALGQWKRRLIPKR